MGALQGWREKALRVAVGTLIAVGAVTCGIRSREPVSQVQLPGVWEGDLERVDELWAVASQPDGPERDLARTRARESMRQLVITFTDDLATLQTGSVERAVPYRVKSIAGPIVILEGLHDDTWVQTSLQVQDDRLTWYDAAGEIEFVLRRREAAGSDASSSEP